MSLGDGQDRDMLLTFSAEAWTELEALIAMTGAHDHAEMLRMALSVYHTIGPALVDGDLVFIQHKDGTVSQVVVHGFTPR